MIPKKIQKWVPKRFKNGYQKHSRHFDHRTTHTYHTPLGTYPYCSSYVSEFFISDDTMTLELIQLKVSKKFQWHSPYLYYYYNKKLLRYFHIVPIYPRNYYEVYKRYKCVTSEARREGEGLPHTPHSIPYIHRFLYIYIYYIYWYTRKLY